MHLDASVQAVLGKGLEFFEVDPSWLNDPSACPYSWPLLFTVADQDTVQTCGSSALVFGGLSNRRLYNIRCRWDFSHGSKDDLKQAISSTSMWGFQLIATVAARTLWGPFGEGLRREQVQQCLASHLREHSERSCPLFQHFLPRLLADEGRLGCGFWQYWLRRAPRSASKSGLRISKFGNTFELYTE